MEGQLKQKDYEEKTITIDVIKGENHTGKSLTFEVTDTTLIIDFWTKEHIEFDELELGNAMQVTCNPNTMEAIKIVDGGVLLQIQQI